MSNVPGMPGIPPGGVLLGNTGAGKAPGTEPWAPAETDLIKTVACPFTSSAIAIQVGPGQFALTTKHAPCHRKCALFVKDETHENKGFCAQNPPWLMAQSQLGLEGDPGTTQA